MKVSDLNIYHRRDHSPELVVVDLQYQKTEPWLHILDKYVGSLEGTSILDIGCGFGGLILSCSNLGAHSFGVDPSHIIHIVREGMVNATGHAIPLVCADGRALPFKSESFDVVMSIGVLEHITRAEALVEEMARVLKPGGKFLLFFGPNKRLRFTTSSTHRRISYTFWTPEDAERLMRKLQLYRIRRVWAEVIQFRFQHLSFIYGAPCWFQDFTKVLISIVKKLRFLGVTIGLACRALELISLPRNIYLVATKQGDLSPTEGVSSKKEHYAGMNNGLMDILICPECKNTLELTAEMVSDDEVISGVLYCSQCDRKYPILDSIPVFVSQE